MPRITVTAGHSLMALLPDRDRPTLSLSARLNQIADRYTALVAGACPALTHDEWLRVLHENAGPVTASFMDDREGDFISALHAQISDILPERRLTEAEAVAVAEINDRYWLKVTDDVNDIDVFLQSLGAKVRNRISRKGD